MDPLKRFSRSADSSEISSSFINMSFVEKSISILNPISQEPQLYKRVCPSVSWLDGHSITLLSAGRDKTGSGYCRVRELVSLEMASFTMNTESGQ